MSTKESTADKASPAFASPTFLLGVDGKGRHHVYSRRTHTVHVVDGTERVHVTALDGDTDPALWMTFVADELCGWSERAYEFTPAYRIKRLAEAIA